MGWRWSNGRGEGKMLHKSAVCRVACVWTCGQATRMLLRGVGVPDASRQTV